MKKEHLASMVFSRIEKAGDMTAIKYKSGETWHGISYRELGEKIRAVACALIDAGIKEGDRVGIFSQNMPEWAIADFGILSVNAISVPVYATNTRDQAEYIIRDANISLMFTGDQVQYDKVLPISESSGSLTKIVSFNKDVVLKGNKSQYFSDFLSFVQHSDTSGELDRRMKSNNPESVATVVYTSGTTGEPKGVMLTHSNFCHQAYSVDAYFSVGPGDCSICFLPLSHVYERSWSYYIFRNGATNCYVSDPKKVIELMQEVKPNVMVSVPRLYEKIYSAFFHKVEHSSPAKKTLAKWSVRTGREYAFRQKDGKKISLMLKLSHGLADRLVLKKLRAIVGGDKKFFSAGGAALSKEIEEFFFSVGLLICQGYGLTESSPIITFNTPGDFKFGTVGKPAPLCDVKIAEDGEILAKGPNIMKGYLNKPEETAKTVVDGWLRTGDVGEIDEDGFVRITGRIKDIIVLSTGKNIAPQHIETIVGMDHFIDQIAVIGDNRKFVTAIVVPSFEALEEYAKEKGLQYANRKELVAMPEIIAFYRDRIDNASETLADYEKIKVFHIVPEEFSQQGGELTPTLKVRRKVVKDKYSDKIDAMYKGKPGE